MNPEHVDLLRLRNGVVVIRYKLWLAVKMLMTEGDMPVGTINTCVAWDSRWQGGRA